MLGPCSSVCLTSPARPFRPSMLGPCSSVCLTSPAHPFRPSMLGPCSSVCLTSPAHPFRPSTPHPPPQARQPLRRGGAGSGRLFPRPAFDHTVELP
eukprot:355605-Chlamydomonas_euryale.AAC.1